MKTVFEYKSIEASKFSNTFTAKKLLKLSKRYGFVIRADIFFNKENNDFKKGNICRIRLSLPGPEIYASSSGNSFENSIN
ncbi:HPF/RaiA family ribosome-associated protein [uncultured Aquimarina sp.]|uniref:HPF/RaiA family ribosome-associated protein n=1 Tax=uncultured Aquimarina sp. TaxID=575652 RepID=UPI00262852E6|nr:HPF/RaiA family ribosome-associated protein [uncultured Aquimarina sp.]